MIGLIILYNICSISFLSGVPSLGTNGYGYSDQNNWLVFFYNHNFICGIPIVLQQWKLFYASRHFILWYKMCILPYWILVIYHSEFGSATTSSYIE